MTSSFSKRRSKISAAVNYVELLDRRVLMSASTATAAQAASAEHPAWMEPAFTPSIKSFTKAGGFLTATSKKKPLDVGLDFLRSASTQAGLAAATMESPFITSTYTDDASNGGMTHTYLQEEFNGLPVLNTAANVSVDAKGRVIAASTSFVSASTAENGVRAVKLSAADALRAISDELGITLARGVRSLQQQTGIDRVSIVAAPDYQTAPISASLAYVAMDKGQMELVWHTIVDVPDGSHWYELGVSATTGKVLYSTDYVDSASYNVFALPNRSPSDSTRTVLTDPQDATASPFGWHDTNGVAGPEFTITRGNNVYAGLDRVSPDGIEAGTSPDGGASLVFNPALDLTQAPTTSSNQAAAVTNLFYLNNSIHDITYGYGFNEVAGNFQVNNYGHGGAGNDAVTAEAQDYAGTNNANFATPADGSAPRMRMYLFTSTNPQRDGDLDAEIVLHEYTHGISNRLTGGPANAAALDNTQSAGMGEGWSDWMGLMLTMKPTDTATTSRTVGTYALGQPLTGSGVRRQPYNTNMAINNQTASIYAAGSSDEHNTGEIWCDALWDMSWNLIGRYGFSSNLYGGWSPGQAGNKLAIQLVINAMKLQPSNPRLSDARDAILQADVNLTGGANADLIWQAFARRGMGFSFNSGANSNATTTVVAAFDVPGQISGKVTNDANDNGVVDTGEAGSSGATVYLDADNDGIFDAGETSTTTDASGNYVFNGLAAATYNVRVTKSGTHASSPTPAVYSVAVNGPTAINAARNFTISTQQRIGGVAYNDANANGVRDNGEAGLAGATVFIDTNLNGVFDPPALDQTVTTPLAIPDAGAAVFSNMVVSGVPGTVSNIGVRLNITHTFDGDLDIFLISPLGTRIELSTDNGSSADGINVTLLDSAASSVTGWPTTSGVGPVTGTWRPEGLLSAFNGQSFNGTWKLEITDDASQDVGTVNSWSLFQGTGEASKTTAADGSYLFTNLAPGGATVAQVAIAGRTFTSPATGSITLGVVGTGSVLQADFGSAVPAPTSYVATSGADTIYVKASADNANLQIYLNATGTGVPAFEVSKASLGSSNFLIDAGGGDDTIYFDYANGDPAPAGGLTLDLGAGSADRLNVYGTVGADTFNFTSGSIASNVSVTGHESIGLDGKLGGDQLIMTSGPTVQLLATQELASLSVSGGQILDLQTFGVIDTLGAQLDSLYNTVAAGYNTGVGIVSSWVAADSHRVVGIGPSSVLGFDGGTFMGIAVDGSSVLIRPTLKGDFSLNGTVNFDDLVRLAMNYNFPNRTFIQGDTDYDGNANFNDLVGLAQNYSAGLLQFGQLIGGGSESTAAAIVADTGSKGRKDKLGGVTL